MDLSDVNIRLKRKNKILFTRDSACLQDLLVLIRKQKHRTLVMWVFECLEPAAQVLREHYPQDDRVQIAVDLCKQWAMGKVKMPMAKKALLQVHAIAKEIDNNVDIALCHAIGQALGCIHVETHAIGFVMYELSAIVFQYEHKNYGDYVEKRIIEYMNSLVYWEKHIDEEEREWADFLADDFRPNKEMLLYIKKNNLTVAE